jgi:cyclin T
MVFFHRFYAVHSFEEHDRFEVAVACILLAAKTEESPKKLVSILQECFRLKNNAMKNKTPQEGVKLDKRGYLDMKCQEYTRLKERILLLERVILHTIGFELSISHPYIHFGKVSQ